MSQTIAQRVHDLIRDPLKRATFQKHIHTFLADRAANPGQPWPLHRLDADGYGWDDDEPAPVRMIDKYALLGAIHDAAYALDGPVMPPPDCTTSEGRIWHLLLGSVADPKQQAHFADRLDEWCKDVEADLATMTPARHLRELADDAGAWCLGLLQPPPMSWDQFRKEHMALIGRLNLVAPMLSTDAGGRALVDAADHLLGWATKWRKAQPKAGEAESNRAEDELDRLLQEVEKCKRWEPAATPAETLNPNVVKQITDAVVKANGRLNITPSATEPSKTKRRSLPKGKPGRPAEYPQALAVVKKMRPKSTWVQIFKHCEANGIDCPDKDNFARTMRKKLSRERTRGE